MRRQEMAGLTCGGYEHRTVRVGEIIDPAIACAMDVFKRFWPAAAYTAAHQRIVAAACGLADIHKILKQEIVAQGKQRAWLFAQDLVDSESQSDTGFEMTVTWTAKQEKQFNDL